MNGTKNPLASMTIWGAMVLLVANGLRAFYGGDVVSPEEQAALTANSGVIADAAAQVVGLVLVIWGRIRATKAIG